MSVIIRGMTMPESCEDCRFLCDFGPHYKICGAVDRELIVTDLFMVRHDECPLCEVIMGVELANGEDFTGGAYYEAIRIKYGNQTRKTTLYS